MSASGKLKALGKHPGYRFDLANALPQIVAVVEAAEKPSFEYDQGGRHTVCRLCGSILDAWPLRPAGIHKDDCPLAALDKALP